MAADLAAQGANPGGAAVAPAAMAEILSTIRSNLAEETVRVAMGAPASEVPATPDDAGDVLELSPADLAPAVSNAAISAPAPNPVESPAAPTSALLAELNVPEPAAAASGPADDFDRLLQEISTTQASQAEAVNEQRAALLAEEEPLTDVLAGPETAPQTTPVAEVSAPIPQANVNWQASLVQVAGGDLQVALPAEVLALALRPLVQDWLKANLPQVVEKLVQAEIAKLSGQV